MDSSLFLGRERIINRQNLCDFDNIVLFFHCLTIYVIFLMYHVSLIKNISLEIMWSFYVYTYITCPVTRLKWDDLLIAYILSAHIENNEIVYTYVSTTYTFFLVLNPLFYYRNMFNLTIIDKSVHLKSSISTKLCLHSFVLNSNNFWSSQLFISFICW